MSAEPVSNSISRRSILAASAGGLTASLMAMAAPASAATGPVDAADRPRRGRPNFLWILTEDNNPFNGAYGDRVANTPNIDRLAREGILFEVAYCPSPVCAPSRFSYLTGLYPQTAGPAHHMRALAKVPSWIRGFPEFLRNVGYYTTNDFKEDFNVDVDMAATWDASGRGAHWRNRPDGAPFFAQFTTLANHESQVIVVKDGSTDPDDVHVPEYLPDTPEIRRGIAHSYNRQTAADADVGRWLSELDADGLAEDTIVFYFGDNGGALPWSKRFANNNGLHIPLIVRVPDKWLHLVTEGPGTRVETPVNGVDMPPTTLALAGLDVPHYMQGQTLLIRGEGRRQRDESPYTFGGRNRMDERYDMQRTVRDEQYMYIRNYMPHRPYGQYVAYMWQQPAYQIWEQAHLEGSLNPVQDRFWGEKPWEELYDVLADPDQVHNLVDVPRHRGVLERLRRAVDEHILQVNDNGFIPESHPAEGYEQSRVPGVYPLEDVAPLAADAARRDPGNLDRFIDALTHGNDIVRYWAAQGVLMLGDHAGGVSDAVTARFQAETSDFVKIPLAEALARLGHTHYSVAYLAQTLESHARAWLGLQAIDALTYVGVAALPFKAVVENAMGGPPPAPGVPDPAGYVQRAARYLSAVLNGTYTPTATLA